MGPSTHLRRGSPAVVALLILSVSSAVLADQASEVAALDGQCEAAREAKIKPLREVEIS